MKEKLTILENIFRHTVVDIVIDYQISYDITGKVYKVVPLIYQLPESAQRLILGGDKEEKKQEIEKFKNLISLILPLGIMNQSNFFQEELKEIYKAVNEEIKTQQISFEKLFKYAEKESLEYYILSSYLNQDGNPMFFNEIGGIAKALVENIADQNSLDCSQLLRHPYAHVRFKIIPFILPFINEKDVKRNLYEAIGEYKDNSCKVFLMNALTQHSDGKIIKGILKSLAQQSLTDDLQVQKKVLAIYYSDIEFGEQDKIYLMQLLQQFPNKDSIATGLEILHQNQDSAESAAKALLHIGYPVADLASFLITKLRTCDKTASKVAFKVLSDSRFSDFLPDDDQLIQIFVNTMASNRHQDFIKAMFHLIKWKYDRNTPYKIIKHLSNPNINIVEAILRLINFLLNNHRNINININVKPFISEGIQPKYLEIIDQSDYDLPAQAIFIMRKTENRKMIKKLIPELVERIDFSRKNRLKNVYLMKGINTFLSKVEYNPIINDKYFEALDMSYDLYRVEAIRGLINSPDPQLKKSLIYLKNDPSKEVQTLLKKRGVFPSETLMSNKTTKTEKIIGNRSMVEKVKEPEPTNSNLFNELIQKISSLIKFKR